MLTEEDYDEIYEKVNAFHIEFKALVRKHLPKFPTDEKGSELHTMIQERTSTFAPYIWSDENKNEKGEI